MFTRIRWFIYGSLATAALALMVVRRARLMRERLDAQGVGRVAASYGADAIEFAGRYLQRAVPQDTAEADGLSGR